MFIYSQAHFSNINYRSITLLLLEHMGTPYVPLQPIVKSLGISWRHQERQLASGDFAAALLNVRIQMPHTRRDKNFMCLPLLKLHSWIAALAGEDFPSRARHLLADYQTDCAETLWAAWNEKRERADGAATLVNACYQGRHFRFRRIGNEWWYAATDVAAALGLRDTPSLLRILDESQRLKLLIGLRHLQAINQAGLEQAYRIAPPYCTEALRLWLSALQRTEPRDHLSQAAAVRSDCADQTLHYLSRMRESIKALGGKNVEWDEEQAQRIADNLASLLIRNRRWLLTFDDGGQPQLAAVPTDAGVFTHDKLVEWISDLDGPSPVLLERVLHAVGSRLRGSSCPQL